MTALARLTDEPVEILTIEEFADRMKCRPRTIKRAIDAGWVTASQVNPKKGGWRFEWPAAAAELLAARRAQQREPRPALVSVTPIGASAGVADRARKPRSTGRLRLTPDMGRDRA